MSAGTERAIRSPGDAAGHGAIRIDRPPASSVLSRVLRRVRAPFSGRRRLLAWAAGAAVLALGPLGAWAFWLEPRSLLVRETTLALPGWPEADRGLRVAVLADIHAGAPYIDRAKLRRIVDMTNAARPDAVVFLGDLVIQGVKGGRFIPPEDTCAILRDLRAPLGLYAVLGNHDYWLDSRRVADALSGAGFRVLRDEATLVSTAGRSFWIAGANDLMEGTPVLRRTLRDVPEGAPVLLLTHNPDIFPSVPGRVTLTLAGHTHGGQVSFPILGRLIVPSLYGSRYAIGPVEEKGRRMFVATGIGTSMVPVRFRVPPEITLLTLVPAPSP